MERKKTLLLKKKKKKKKEEEKEEEEEEQRKKTVYWSKESARNKTYITFETDVYCIRNNPRNTVLICLWDHGHRDWVINVSLCVWIKKVFFSFFFAWTIKIDRHDYFHSQIGQLFTCFIKGMPT